MFGESESESPRVPSPWDSLISNSPSPSPTSRSRATPSPLPTELLPKLVPEADDGNVEYKLQLLSPSPARFARLVTQLKWRLLEGGGQAYYELGVADSGALVGLPRAELEQSLETLEMMAGDIGASVIIVKEIEIPAILAELTGSSNGFWIGNRKQGRDAIIASEGSGDGGCSTTMVGTTETELSTTDVHPEDGKEGMSSMVVFEKDGRTALPCPNYHTSSIPLSAIDLDPDPADNADAETDEESSYSVQPRFSIDLEIASVFKPRPTRTRFYSHTHPVAGPAKNKRPKKYKPSCPVDTPASHLHGSNRVHHYDSVCEGGQVQGKQNTRAFNRRQARDRKREEKRKALLAYATGDQSKAGLAPAAVVGVQESRETTIVTLPASAETNALVSGLESLHVSLDEHVPVLQTSENSAPTLYLMDEPDEEVGDDDVFALPTRVTSSHISPSSAVQKIEESLPAGNGEKGKSRLIVEALVVRKISLDEAFLDFGGFALT